MIFDQIKAELESSVAEKELPGFDLSCGVRNPISQICRTMLYEIQVQLCCLVVFFFSPFVFPMLELPRAVYFLMMFVTGMLTFSYIVKFRGFRNRNVNLHLNTRETLSNVVKDARQTIENYECCVIAGCALLPISMFALATGNVYFEDAVSPQFFDDFFLLRTVWWKILAALSIYALCYFGSIWITKTWSRFLYGAKIEKLEAVLLELDHTNEENPNFDVTNSMVAPPIKQNIKFNAETRAMKNLDWVTAVLFVAFIGVSLFSIWASPVAGSIIVTQEDRNPQPDNLGFEENQNDEFPSKWTATGVRPKSRTTAEEPFDGNFCLEIKGDYVFQAVDAKPYRGKKVRYRAAVRVQENSRCHAQLILDIGTENETTGELEKSINFYNMSDRPITHSNWKHQEIILDVPEQADYIRFGCFTVGHGSAWIDDVSLEIVELDAKVSGYKNLLEPKPGLYKIRGVRTVNLWWKKEATLLYPMPLAYRDQVPVSYSFVVEPEDALRKLTVVSKDDQNHVLQVDLKAAKSTSEIKLTFESDVLVGDSSFKLPATVKLPTEWPADILPWTKPTWCADADHERFQKIAKSILEKSDGDLIKTIENCVAESEKILGEASGRSKNLTATEALDKSGSCTSCANLVAAILRACKVPARIVSGYPSWHGPLETHYIVEAFVPDFGWYPIESSLSLSPFPNSGQINVSIIPVQHESEELAGQRTPNAAGVPYLSLVEYATRGISTRGAIASPRHKHCTHECKLVKLIDAKPGDWQSAFDRHRKQWSEWLATNENGSRANLKFDGSPTLGKQ